MYYYSAEISSSDLALRALNKPLLVGRNWARDMTTDPEWSAAGSWAGADAVESGYETVRLSDDYSHLSSRPSPAADTYYLLLDLGSSAPGIIDFVALLGVVDDFALTQIDVQIANDSAYSTDLITVASKTPSTDGRVIFNDLHHTGSTPLRYSDVRYLRIKFTGVLEKPEFGEIIIGRSRQLKSGPLTPFDSNNLISRVDDFESMSGIKTRYVHHKNRRRISTTLSMYEDAFTGDFEEFFENDINGGTQPFLWIDKPGSEPTLAYWMMYESPELIGPAVGWIRRNFILNAVEQGPGFLKNES